MGEKIYYPAVFFTDIVEYYGGSESYIEEVMRDNIAKAKAEKLSKLKDSLEDLKRIDSKGGLSDEERMGVGILNDLLKIKEGEKEQKKIKKLERITNKVKTMSQIDGKIAEKIIKRIQLISEKESKTGYSDTSIFRFKDMSCNALREDKYNDIIDYLVEPETENDYSDLSKRLWECIHNLKYSHIPVEKFRQIERYLTRDDFSGKHLLRIFRILEQCSYGFHKINTKKIKQYPSEQTDWEIIERISKALQNIWGEIEVEGVGFTQEEKSRISFDVSQDLLKDYKFYYENISFDVESSKGFQALIFYRLYNKVFYYMREYPISCESIDEMQKAMSFFAFSILQRAIEHTEILIHPAARIESPIYIGNKVMIGKQCGIKAESVLGNNVCLYPFNIYNREMQGQNTYISVGGKTIFCKNTKVLGCIDIGDKCIINKSILVGNDIENNMYVTKDRIIDIDEKMYLEMKTKIMEGIL